MNAKGRRRGLLAPIAVIFVGGLLISGCYGTRRSSGGGQTDFEPPRVLNPEGVAVPSGYAVEIFARDLTFPSGIAFDESGVPYVIEAGYVYGETWTVPRLIKLEGSNNEVITEGGRNGPWNGICFHKGNFYIAEGGQLEGGKILRISKNGSIDTLLSGLPSQGDHHTNGPVVGPDGNLYFGQGTATNSGVVGEDNWEFGWLQRNPDFHDVPGSSMESRGLVFDSKDPRDGERGKARTGAFAPFGQQIEERTKSDSVVSGSVVKMSVDGGKIEQVAWGFRNPFGLAFSPDGSLYVTDNGYDNRGSRPVWGAPDLLWKVRQGVWHGWPDFAGDMPLTDRRFQPPGKKRIEFLLASHPNTPPAPVARLAVHSSSTGLDFSRSAGFGHVGQAFIAQFGDMAPSTSKVLSPVGFKIVRVDPSSGAIEDFAVNRSAKNGPASKVGGGGLERPISVRFSPDGNSLYVVDFGVLTMQGKKPIAHPGTGCVWKISRREAP